MRFCVTSIIWEESSASVNAVTVRLQDILNALLGDGSFGGDLQQFTVFVVSYEDDFAENQKYASACEKLGRFIHPVTGERIKALSVSVAFAPRAIVSKSPNELLPIIVTAIIARLSQRPKRLPKGFEYERFASAVRAVLQAYTTKA